MRNPQPKRPTSSPSGPNASRVKNYPTPPTYGVAQQSEDSRVKGAFSGAKHPTAHCRSGK